MPLWDVVRDLEVDLTDADLTRVIKNMKPEDWELVKKELEQAVEHNEYRKKTADLLIKLIEIFLSSGIRL